MAEIVELADDMVPAWDNFVTNCPTGLPTQLSGWKNVLKDSYGYITRFLLAIDDQGIQGVLPLFQVNSPLMGRLTTTLPGGLCTAHEGVAQKLMQAGVETAQLWGSGRFRLHDTRQNWSFSGLTTSTHHEHWLVNTAMDAEDLWTNLDGNIRRQVRKARKNGLISEIDRSGRLLTPFYDLFSHFVHGQGTPAFGRDFLENVVDAFPEGFNICLVWKDNQPIAGYFQLEMGQTITGMWGGALPEYLSLRPVYLGIWTIMEDTAQRGFTYLDMGRSPAGSNASHFKGQWGGRNFPVHQQVYSLSNDISENTDLIAEGLDSNQNMSRFMKWWPRIPYPVAQLVGPRLRRHIPFG